ncbi:MAG TPA: spermidine/putrescine ABC transporter permease [Rhodospirillaceae bacterium]|nr:spermidine/putrescine ABC transporter permease [Rhodospirillaceae bacterium]MAX64263.1 spermidine/putrescine ABC transporter permease [Rhodospirillaceae bacterium]MBB58175.1 spermidine/putrescine ABC transporter permease [Rhodospirillaceae bacterium]HAJ22530.1 spermidine/putrescine ABC transporter permease [Rhodospirillaceae bacterium]|tara:strand:+ start:41194 stop:42114 length:921 start_codon:yes stop_codon:yes gene_type:complete
MESWRKFKQVFWAVGIPPTFWLVLFFLVPLALIWLFSFGEKQGVVGIDITWTLDNYIRVFNPDILKIFWKSLGVAGLATIICLFVGLPVALGIVYAPNKYKGLLLLLIMLPFWTNLLIRTYALIAVLRQRGFLNFTLEWFDQKMRFLFDLVGLGGLGAAVLGEQFQALELLYNDKAVILGLVYVHLPFMILPLYAALERLDRSYLEASLDLGAGHLRTIWNVVVPLALPGIVSGIIITFIPALGSFLTPDLLGGPDSAMIANIIERQFKSANDWPFGSALSFLLMYITFGALALRAIMARNSKDGI